jgi:hypothetical protein
MTYSKYSDPNYLASPSNTHESQASDATQGSFNVLGTWSVLSTSAVRNSKSASNTIRSPMCADRGHGIAQLVFPGLTVGPVNWMPQWHARTLCRAATYLTRTADRTTGRSAAIHAARMWDDYHVLGRGQMTFTSLPATSLDASRHQRRSTQRLGPDRAQQDRSALQHQLPKTDFGG